MKWLNIGTFLSFVGSMDWQEYGLRDQDSLYTCEWVLYVEYVEL